MGARRSLLVSAGNHRSAPRLIKPAGNFRFQASNVFGCAPRSAAWRLGLGLSEKIGRWWRSEPSVTLQARLWKVLPAGRRYSSRALEVMQRNFGQTVYADGNDGCPDTDRGITHHIAMFPRSRAHMPGQNRIKSDWDRPRQTDLTSVGMTAHKQIETAMCSLPVDFRRMGQEN